METNIAAEKDDLAKAKHDLLLRFIKDQEQLQTSAVGRKSSNNDETFDILDGIAGDNLCNNKGGINEHSHDRLDEIRDIRRCKTCMPSLTTHKDDFTLVELKEERLHYKLKSVKKRQDKGNRSDRPSTQGSLIRLKSAPSLTGKQSRNIFHSGDIEVKTRKMSSLNIVVPKEGNIEKITRRRSSLTCTQVTRPRGAVGISAVDVKLFDTHSLPSVASPYTMYHLPPITSKSAQTPPST